MKTKSLLSAELNLYHSTRIKMMQAAGDVLNVEVMLRILAEHSPSFQSELKSKNKEYWNCVFYDLEDAFDKTLGKSLIQSDREKIKKFRELRNSMLHGNFKELMEHLNIPTTSRLIGSDGKRVLLKNGEVIESIKSITHQDNKGFEKLGVIAGEVAMLLENLLINLGT